MSGEKTKQLVISWRTVEALRKHAGGVFLALTAAAVPRGPAVQQAQKNKKLPCDTEASGDNGLNRSALAELSGGSENKPGACFPARPQRLCREDAAVQQEIYLLENWGARRAPLRPYFFLSFILGSLVRKPAFLSSGRRFSSYCRRALARP